MTNQDDRRVVEQFWAAMNTNDFRAAGAWLHDDYVLEWPQSGERIRGRDNLAVVNAWYTAAGPWQFTVNRILADQHQVVTDVTVTDGIISAQAITFSEVRDGKIVHQTEHWPEPFEAPVWRAQWVERGNR